MSKLPIEDALQVLDTEDRAQTAFQAKYGPAARLERTTLGLSAEAKAAGHSWNLPRFQQNAEGDAAWERFAADCDSMWEGQNAEQEAWIAAAIGKREAPQTIEVERQEQRKAKRPKRVGVINDGPVGGCIKV